MVVAIKYSIKFDLELRKQNGQLLQNNVPVRMRLSYAGRRLDFALGIRISLSEWDIAQQHPRKGPHEKQIIHLMSAYHKHADEVFARFQLIENRVPDPSEVRTLIREMASAGKLPQRNSSNFVFDRMEEFVQTMGTHNQWAPATRAKFYAIRQHLYRFNRKLNLDSLCETDMQEYVRYLMRLDFRNLTISRNIAFTRWFLRWANKRGYYKGNLHVEFRPRFKGTDGNSKEVIHLTWDELIHMYNFEIPDSKLYLQRVRDVFCFTCFTGLRYSDAAKLRRSDVKPGHISVVTQKTVDGIKIELNKYSKTILDKYKRSSKANRLALPAFSNANMNKHLKELGRMVGLNEPQRIVYFKGSRRIEEVYPKHAVLTTHCGRRTFIVNALYLGIPAEVVMKWTGHNDYNAMKPYIKIVDALKEEAMNKFNER